MDSLSQKRFAIHVGVSRQYIGRLVASGKLPVLEDKSIPMPVGLEAFQALRVDAPAAAALGNGEQAPPRPSAMVESMLDLRGAQLDEKRSRARLLDLEYRRKSGELIPRPDVIADGRAAGAAIRERLLSLPSRCALQLEAALASAAGPLRAAEIEGLIADEINLVLMALHATRFPEIAEDAPPPAEQVAR